MGELIEKMKQHFNGTWDAVESDERVFQLILIRHPVRSVLIFKSVAKFWHSVLSTKVFKLLYQIRSREYPKYLVYYDAGKLEDGKVCHMHLMEHNGVYSESYFLPEFETIDAPRIISSFNGLICCVNDVSPSSETYEVDIRICNPATREVLLLPRGCSSRTMPIFGVMHSDRSLFYKIFKFFSDPIDVEDGYAQCEVYSSVTGSWHEVGMVDIFPGLNLNRALVANHVCVNEKLYLFVLEEDGNLARAILMVDMEENFKEIYIPTKPKVYFLLEIQGLLCYIEWTGSDVFIFTHDEDDNRWFMWRTPKFPVSWSKIAHFDSVAAIGEEILFVYTDVSGSQHKKLYDMRVGTWRDFRIPEDDKDQAIVVFPFYETLIPCIVTDEEDDLSDEGEVVTDEEDDLSDEGEDS